MDKLYPVTIVIIIANVVFSLIGFSNPRIFERYKFNVGAILRGKQWERMISSAFLHGNGMHLAFNMFSLLMFGSMMEHLLGVGPYLLLYFGAMLTGDFLSLLTHRNHPHYSAIGASGAVSGVIFAAIIFQPQMKIGMFFIPPIIPAWIFGILYTAYSIWGVRAKRDNIGHEAHLGGALGGMGIYACFRPDDVMDQPLLFAALTVPIIVLAFLVYYKPGWFGGKSSMPNSRPFTVIEPERSRKSKVDKITLDRNPKSEMQQELDSYLEKVKKFGYDGLSKEEKERLNRLSELLGKD
jgi:membrane associated rhomboid family serine protease